MNILETLVGTYLKANVSKVWAQLSAKGAEMRVEKVTTIRAFKRRFDVDLVFRLADEPKVTAPVPDPSEDE
jgi:hypothetical protein